MKFRTTALEILNGIYRFVGGGKTAPEDYDVSSDIQSVHDLHREAELGAYRFDPRAGGFFQVGNDNVHGAGGSTVNATLDPYASTDTMFGTGSSQRVWIWVYKTGISLTGSGGTGFTQATITARITALGNALATRDFLLGFTNSSMAHHVADGTFPLAGIPAAMNAAVLPFPIPAGSTIGFQSVTSAADVTGMTVRLETLCWVGAIGTLPPGMA